MADPFSICLGVITTFSAAKKLCRALLVLKQAPCEIEELRLNLENVTAVLNKVLVTIRTTAKPESPNELLQLALDEAERIAKPLHSCLDKLASDNESSHLRRGCGRVTWSQKRATIKGYAVYLVNVKVNLIFALQAEQMYSSARIETKLESIAEACANIDASKWQLCPTSRDSDNDSQPILDRLTTTLKPSHSTPVSSIFRPPDFLQKCFSLGQNTNEPVSHERCNCNCHFNSNWESPTYLISLLGRIHILRKPSAPCYQSTCRKSCAATSVITSLYWTAPTWLLTQHMLSLTIFSSPYLNLPNVSLSFPRIVASDALIFHFATTGNVAGIKELLENGTASPDDIKCDGGFTPLHYAIQSNRLEVCEFLIKARGRPDLQTRASMTSSDLAIAKILTQAAEEQTLTILAELFKTESGMEDQRFSRLHETVLCLRTGLLAQELDLDLASMDKPDANGRTPLSWAAARGDYEAVSILLDHLADIHLADVGGMTPLHYAATSNSLACLKLLLEQGADPSGKDKDRGWTPLHYASFDQTDSSWVECLITHGADVNVKTDNLKSPLVLAIIKCHDLVARFLVKHGANMYDRGIDGFSPLNSSLLSHSSACMQVLIEAGIELDEMAWKGQTILHLIALYADEEMMECLMKADLSDLNLNATDEAGQTAHMFLKTRTANVSIVKAFVRLCTKISDDAAQKWHDSSA